MTTNVRTHITNGQIGQICDRLTTKLRESGLLSEAVQKVLKMPGNAALDEMVAVFRRHVEAQGEFITRHATVNRTRTQQEAITATGRNKYVNDDVVASMPKGEGNEVDVIFFKLGHNISDADLDKEYELRGLKPADPYSLAAVNEADPAFADEHPNGTHWKDVADKWCYAAFSQWLVDDRHVSVNRFGFGWVVDWWFAGVRK